MNTTDDIVAQLLVDEIADHERDNERMREELKAERAQTGRLDAIDVALANLARAIAELKKAPAAPARDDKKEMAALARIEEALKKDDKEDITEVDELTFTIHYDGHGVAREIVAKK